MPAPVCHYLVYRRRIGKPLDLNNPIGGFMIELEDLQHLRPDHLAKERYECAPGEKLDTLEADGMTERCWAAWFHQLWEVQTLQFLESMGVV